VERALYWLGEGVQPSDAVRQLLRVSGIWEEFRPGDMGRQRVPSTPSSSADPSASTPDAAAPDDAAPAAQAAEEGNAAGESVPAAPRAAEDAGSNGSAGAASS
jgi:small subunit ribosomal protein S16